MSVIGDDSAVSLFELAGSRVQVRNAANLAADTANTYKVSYVVNRRKYVINCLTIHAINLVLKFVFSL